jgi:hypothetical protein
LPVARTIFARSAETQKSQFGFLQRISGYCAVKPTNETDKWQHDFWCEIKSTDVIIATFTVLLVGVKGGLIIVGLWQIRTLTKNTAIKFAPAKFKSTGTAPTQQSALAHVHYNADTEGHSARRG